MRITLSGDDVQGSDTKWDEVLLSMREAPKDGILESMYKTKLRDSEQLRSTPALYKHETVQKSEPTRYTRLKNMVKRYLDQVTGARKAA